MKLEIKDIEMNNEIYGFCIYSNRGNIYEYDDFGLHKRWVDGLNNILIRNKIKDIDNYKISKCLVGDSSYPVAEIKLENGITIYLEDGSPSWAKEENDKVFSSKRIRK